MVGLTNERLRIYLGCNSYSGAPYFASMTTLRMVRAPVPATSSTSLEGSVLTRF
jgi:NAD(P)H-hydrate repair Nnr-like enzyme with NAD(P)H-hydrate dehydratase domain